VHKTSYGLFHRCRKAKRLPLERQVRQNTPNGWQEAHIQHAIGFIEHENLHLTKISEFARNKILEPSGSSNDEPTAAAQSSDLFSLLHASNNKSGPGDCLTAQCLVLLVHLHR
jgi:hypothetical protein